MVVFCAKATMDDDWLHLLLAQENADGRFATTEAMEREHKGRSHFADVHRKHLKDDDQWMAKQVYLNVGNFLLGVAAMGLDAVPIEGFDAAVLDEELGLQAKGSPAWSSCQWAITARMTTTPHCRSPVCRRALSSPSANPTDPSSYPPKNGNAIVMRTKLISSILFLFGTAFAIPSYADTTREGDLAFAKQMREDFKSSVASVGTPEQVAERRDFTVIARKPKRQIPVRLHLTANTEAKKMPIVLFIHGGGFVAGDLDSYDPMLTGVANRASAAVLSGDYRLAPENPFPAWLEDAYAVLKWAAKNASSFGADGSRIAISDDSAGGNIAAATAMLARDRHGPKLTAPLLMYPTVSNKMDTPSWKEFRETHFPTHEINSKVIDAYVTTGTSHYAPLVAPQWGDHQKLPPTFTIVGNLDPLRDEDKDYAEKMRRAGGEAQVIV